MASLVSGILISTVASSTNRSLEEEFWGSLAAYEHATIQESQCIATRDFEQLSRLSRGKSDLLQRMERIARSIGIDRSDSRLAKRLSEIQCAESLNQNSIGCALSEIKGEIDGVRLASRRLVSVRGAYSEPSTSAEFLAQG